MFSMYLRPTLLLLPLLLFLLLFSLVSSISNQHGLANNLTYQCPPKQERRELERLVHTSPSRSFMFILAHNNDSRLIAHSYHECYANWTSVAQLPITPYFESILYHSFLPHVLRGVYHLDYVILVTYKVLNRKLLPRYMPVLSFNGIERMLRIAQSQQYDVLPFMRDFEEMMPTSVKYHTENFRIAWDNLLLELGFNQSTIEQHYTMKAFYRNVFIIRPSVLVKLTLFMNKALQVAEKNPRIRNLLRHDAHYVLGSQRVARAVFGTPYYQLHPFIFERLPAFYLNAIGAKICTGPDTPCKYNYKG